MASIKRERSVTIGEATDTRRDWSEYFNDVAARVCPAMELPNGSIVDIDWFDEDDLLPYQAVH